MSFIKYAASFAALLAAASAEDGCTFDSPTTLTAAADVSSLASCQTISGTVGFATGIASQTLALPQLAIWNGDWNFEGDSDVQAISAPSLQQISGAMNFQNMRSLGSINLQSLQKSGDVTLAGLSSLQSVTTGPQYSEAGAISLTNTQLDTLGGFGNLTKIRSIDVTGNLRLADITMDISSVSKITISSNELVNHGLSVSFNNLSTVLDTISIKYASSLSLPELKNVTHDLDLENNVFSSFAAPKLSAVSGIFIISNSNLRNISFPLLTTLGRDGLTIANNTGFENIGGFDNLTTVQGGVTIKGDFKNASYANFKRIEGGVIYLSTQDIHEICDNVNQFHATQISQGKSTCNGTDPSAIGDTKSGSGTGSASSESSSGAAGLIDIPALPALSAGIGAALLQFLLSF